MPRHTILLVDYEPRSIERTRAALTNAGLRVEVAMDGISGQRRFDDLRPDLALIEAMIPKKPGFELCQELKKTPFGKNTPIVIITGVYKGRKYRSQALHLFGADEFLEKPIADDDLVAAVRKLLPPADEPARVPAPAEPPAAEQTAPEPVDAAAPSAARRRRLPPPGAFSEEDIVSRLDAIMPDEPSPAPSPARPRRPSL